MSLQKELMHKRTELISILEKASLYLKNAPDGRVRIARRGKGFQYYHVTNCNDRGGKYIKTENQELAFHLVQKEYCRKMKKQAEMELRAIDRALNICGGKKLQTIYEDMGLYRRQMINPIVMSDKDFIEQWMSIPYHQKGFSDDDPKHYSNRGTRVRSKSEVLIANILEDFKIPYKYECPLSFPGIGLIYIDFTLLMPGTREVKYLEHFGMMDDESYLNLFFRKNSAYIENGLIPGVNLIMTFESKGHPLNTKELRTQLKEFIEHSS